MSRLLLGLFTHIYVTSKGEKRKHYITTSIRDLLSLQIPRWAAIGTRS
jgi:hypothetical protein